MSALTQEALLGKLIPNVYIDGVTLESSGDPPPQDNPHIDTGSDHSIAEDKFRASSAPAGNTLRCVVDISIKEVLDNDLIGRWFDDEKVSKYIKLLVVQSTDQTTTRALSNNTTAISLVRPSTTWNMDNQPEKFLAKGWGTSDPEFLKRKLELTTNKRVLDINHDVLGDNSNLTQKRSSVDQDGNSIVDINFRATFIVGEENPRHVSYFAVAYLDMESLMEDYDIRANEYTLKFQNGKVASEVVIDDWKTMGTAITFYDIENRQWSGPVHERADGSWSSGSSESAESISLTLRKVPNSKIHDFRNIKEIQKLRVDLAVLEQELRPVANKLSATNSDAVVRAKKNVYFSEAYLARDRWGVAKLAFALDYYKLVKESSVYNRIYEQASPSQRQKMLNSSRIKSMKFLRRRTTKVLTKNNLGNPVGGEVLFDREEPRVVLAYTGENKNGTLKTVKDRATGGMREIYPALDAPQQGIRFFTAEDRTMYYVTDGHYQYGIEITIEDGSQKFLEGIMKNLLSHKKMLLNYYRKASRPGMTKFVIEMADPHIDTSWERSKIIKTSPGNYEPISNRFTQKFIDEQRARWKNKSQYSPWSKPLFVYLNALDMLTDLSSSVGTKKAIQELTKMTRPESGNPKGIMTLLNLMDSLILNIASVLGVSVSANRNKNSAVGSDRTSSKTSKLPTKTRTIEYWFSNEDYDSNVVKNRGYDYLSVEAGTSRWASILANIANPGLRIVSAEKYRKRVEYEISRYYSKVSADLNLKIGTNIITSGDSMLNTSWGFMSPAICYLAENNISSFVKSAAGTTSDIYSDDYYSSLAGNILYSNSSIAPIFPPDVDADDSALGADAQRFRSSMTGFFSGLNLSLFDADSSDTWALTDVPFLSSLFLQPTCPDIKDSDGNIVEALPDDSSLDPISDPNTFKNYNNFADAKSLNPNTFYLSMMKTFVQTGFANRYSTSNPFNTKSSTVSVGTSEVATDTTSIWDLNKTSNVVNWMTQSSEYMNTVALACGHGFTKSNSVSTSDVVKMLPIQFKSLLLSSVNAGNIKRNLHNLNFDARFSIETNSYYEFNYNLINRIDYLSGYQRTEGMRAKNPIWKPLSFKKWDESVGEYLLCRQKSFECQSLGITKPDGLNLPVYDSYFILVPRTNVKPPSGIVPGFTDLFDRWGDYVTPLDDATIGLDAGGTTTNPIGDEPSSVTFCPPHGSNLRSL